MCTLVPSVCGAASNLLAPAAAKEERTRASKCLFTHMSARPALKEALYTHRHLLCKCLFTHISARPALKEALTGTYYV